MIFLAGERRHLSMKMAIMRPPMRPAMQVPWGVCDESEKLTGPLVK
jgi:hypothetical protein